MKIEPMTEGAGALIARMAADDRKAASELATPETAGPAKVVAAVATGSSQVPPEEYLLTHLENTRASIAQRRQMHEECKKENSPVLAGWADGYADAEELHLLVMEVLCEQMGWPKYRQPDSNSKVSHAAQISNEQ